MRIKQLFLAAALGTAMTTPAMADDGVLTGDTRLACEAILCLATGTQPSECTPSLQRYFSISYDKWKDTVQGRLDFLSMCPASSQNSNMKTLVNAMANGSGRCDAASLNGMMMVMSGGDNPTFSISNVMPGYCSALVNNAYTDLAKTTPMYVGTPDTQGYWVPPSQYAQALKDYNARQAAQQTWGGN